jgi:hypothetical protein
MLSLAAVFARMFRQPRARSRGRKVLLITNRPGDWAPTHRIEPIWKSVIRVLTRFPNFKYIRGVLNIIAVDFA